MSDERNYLVQGMTCGHCRSSVIEEVSEIFGVDHVDVELERGLLSVRGEGFTDAEVESAVTEAGYELAGKA